VEKDLKTAEHAKWSATQWRRFHRSWRRIIKSSKRANRKRR
jgi:hypothetical protein